MTVTAVYGPDEGPVLNVTPSVRDVGSGSGSTAFSVENTGSGLMDWCATESCSWVRLSDECGANGGAFIVEYEASTGGIGCWRDSSSRTCTITVEALGARGSPKTVTIVQAGDKLGFPPKAEEGKNLLGDLLLFGLGALLLVTMDRLRRR